jgi:uncharacterized membrane protein
VHLIASALISLLALALANLSPESVQETGSLLALALVILVPGYLIVLFRFPANRDLELSRRIILCLGLSALLAGLVSLVLMLTPRGLQPASLATILSLLAIFLNAISYIRFSTQPRKGLVSRSRRGNPLTKILSGIPGVRIRGRRRRTPFLPLALVAVLFVAAIAFAVSLNHGSSGEGTTSLEVFWPREALNSQSEPLKMGGELEAIARIINGEKSSTNYTLKLKLNNSTLFTKDLNLGYNETWQGRLGFTLGGSPGLQRLEMQLFREGDFSKPYREVNLGVNLIGDASSNLSQNESQNETQNIRQNNSGESSNRTYVANSSEINAIENSSPVILEEKSKVTVLSAGGTSPSIASGSAAGTQSQSKSQSKSESQSTPSAVPGQGSGASSDTSTSTSNAGSTSEAVTKPESEALSATKDTTISGNQSADIGAQNSGLQLNNSTNESTKLSSAPTLSNTTFFAQPATTPESITSPESSKPPESTGSLHSAPPAGSTKNVSDGNNRSDQSSTDRIERPQENLSPNLPPKLVELTADKTNPVLGGIVQWTANATDPESDRIYYKFLENGIVVNDWAPSNSWIWNTSTAAPGDHKITVLARDGKHSALDSFDDSMNASITITAPNRPPVLKSLLPDKQGSLEKGTTVFWKAVALDPDNDRILYRFLVNDKEARKWSKSNSWSWATQNLQAGDYQITVLARDGRHASEDSFDSIMNATLTLSDPNHAPVLNELKADMDSPRARGAVITWTARATDPDGDRVYYKFLANDREVTDWSPFNSWVWNTSASGPGDYKISVQARDGRHAGAASYDSEVVRAFTITSPNPISNSIPLVQELNPDMISPQTAGVVITWTAKATDPGGDKIYYRFLANDKEVTGWSPSNSWIWNTSAVKPGDYKIGVQARDGRHASEDSFDSSKNATFALQASNQPPILKSLEADNSSPQVQGAVVFWKAVALDSDGDPVLYKFQVNGRDMNRWSKSDNWRWSTKDLPAGDYKIRVLARDGRHAPEDSFDSALETAFALTTEIDQQIDLLMNQRGTKSPAEKDYHSSDIQVAVANDTNSKAILGKEAESSGDIGIEKTDTPRKLG